MILIKPSVQILEQKDLFKHIELVGRTAYKSEDKIIENSAEKFVNMIVDRRHGAVLEHGTVYLKTALSDIDTLSDVDDYYNNQYSYVNKVYDPITKESYAYVTTNYRVLVENGWTEDLNKYGCECTKYHEKRVSVKFFCSRVIATELVRHRIFSFCGESSRFVFYNKDKFNNQITYIIPSWCNIKEGQYNNINLSSFENNSEKIWYDSLRDAEVAYMKCLNEGLHTQLARDVLPMALKIELIMTGTLTQWESFFKLRIPTSAHPDMRELSIPLLKMFQEKYSEFSNLVFN